MANLLLLLLLGGIVAVMAWRVQGERSRNQALEQRANAVAALQNARAEYFRGAMALTSAAVAPDPRRLVSMYYNAQVQGDQDIARATAALMSLDEVADVEAIETLSSTMNEVRREVDSVLAWALAADQRTRVAAAQLSFPELWPQIEQMMFTLDNMAAEQENKMRVSRAEANDALDRTLWLLIGCSFAVMVFSTTTVGFAITRIVRPLRALQKSARSIASGNHVERAPATGPDEVVALVDDFNRMTEALLERTTSLQLSEQRFRNVLDMSRDIIYRLNLQTRTYEYMSPAVLPMTGFTPEELIEMGLSGTMERVHPDDLPRYKTKLDELPSALSPYGLAPAIEYRWKCKNGEYRWLSDNRAVVRDENGQPVATVGTVRDITESKLAEAALRENEERFRSLATLVPIGIFLTDASGNVTYANDHLLAMSGMSLEQACGQPWIENLYPEDRPDIVREISECTGTARGLDCEYQVKDTNGSTHWVRVLTRPVPLGDGRQAGCIGVVEDISERKRTEQDKQTAYETIVTLLAAAAEARDPYTEDHLQRIRDYCEAIALEMGLPPDEAREIGLASLLHDIGKMRVPDSILVKAGSLTREEWEIMKHHTIWGDELLAGHTWLETARQIARWHHENWDGAGYPDGLAGTQIPLSAAIVAVADGFDAMTSDRPYKKAWPPSDAVREIRAQRGKRYAPDVVDAFMRVLKKGQIEKIAARTLRTKKAA